VEEDEGADRDADGDQRGDDGDGPAEAGFAHHEENDEWEDEVKLLLDAKRPDV